MLHVHTAGDLGALVDRLAGILSHAPADPMRPELVSVPSAGVRIWTSLQLARRLGTSRTDGGDLSDGVCANVSFPFPGEIRRAVLAAGPTGPADGHDPWSVEHLVWAVLEAVDLLPEGGLQPIAGLPAVLREVPEGGSGYSVARRVADLFDRYHLHRPTMIRDWMAERDLDGGGGGLAEQHLWQPALWRSVRARLGRPSPPERMPELIEGIRSGRLEVGLPDRICVFGMSVLPGGPGFLELAQALAVTRDVHVFLAQPSDVLADRFLGSAPAPRRRARSRLRSEVDSAADLRNPLLRSWGRVHYETASMLVDAEVGDSGGALGPVKHPTSLLGHLHGSVRTDEVPRGTLDVEGPDDSVQFHACHGPTRQVEVLRDTILHLLRDHEHLREDDVLVVCPALDLFAPLVEACLGPSAPVAVPGRAPSDPVGSAPSLRYHLADRSLAQSAPLVRSLQALLELLEGRFEAPSVIDFLSTDPVRRRFGLDDDALAVVAEWSAELGVRWGLDSDFRESRGGPSPLSSGTWRFGLDRLLLGGAVGSRLPEASRNGSPDLPGFRRGATETVGEVIPFDLDPSETSLAGRLGEVLWLLEDLVERSRHPRPIQQWGELLRHAVSELFVVAPGQSWQVERLLRSLEETERSAERDGESCSVPLTLRDLRVLVTERFEALRGRPAFFRGGITISSLTPLRWVPHKVVVMLGMDAAALSAPAASGDDLLAAPALVGDPDPRSEIRQSILELVLAAEEHLVVIRDGTDVRTNQPIPMAVPVAELRDAVATLVGPARREDFSRRLEVVHPRQPFGEVYFARRSGEPDPCAPRASFDGAAARAAAARRSGTDGPAREGGGPEPGPTVLLEEAEDDEEVPLADLRRFLACPVGHFVECRLQVHLPREAERLSGTLPVALGPLEVYRLGDRLLGLLGSGDAPHSVICRWSEVEVRSGTVPPGILGQAQLQKTADEVLDLHRCGVELGVRLRRPHEREPVDIALDHQTRVVGSVELALEPGAAHHGGPATVRFVRPRPGHALALWVDLAALTLARPEQRWRAACITRAGKGDEAEVAHLELNPSDPQGAARHVLETTVDLYRRGAREPLPLFRTVSADLHEHPDRTPGWPERHPEPAEELVFGDLSPEELCAIPVHPTDPPGEAGDRARRYAHHLYGSFRATTTEVES